MRLGQLCAQPFDDCRQKLRQPCNVRLSFQRAVFYQGFAVFFLSRRSFAHVGKVQYGQACGSGMHLAVQDVQTDFGFYAVYVRFKSQLVIRKHIQQGGDFGENARLLQFGKVGLF